MSFSGTNLPLPSDILTSAFNAKQGVLSAVPSAHIHPSWRAIQSKGSRQGPFLLDGVIVRSDSNSKFDKFVWNEFECPNDCMDAGGRAMQEQLPRTARRAAYMDVGCNPAVCLTYLSYLPN